MNYAHYTYRVTWSDDDQEFVGLCAEFPNLSHLDTTKEGAKKGIVSLVRKTLIGMADDGEVPPVPFVDRPYKN